MMKKLLASLLAIAMVLGLCACGGGSTASSAAPAASEPTEAASAPEQPQEPAAPQEEEQPSPFEQKDWKPTTALDQLSVDIVHQLEALMG